MENILQKKCKLCNSLNVEYYTIQLATGYVCNDCAFFETKDKYNEKCCENPAYTPVLFYTASGSEVARQQCNCGYISGKSIKRHSSYNIFDVEKYKIYTKNILKTNAMYNYLKNKSGIIQINNNNKKNEVANRVKNAENIEFQRKYHEYLKTENWKVKRDLVLKRDKHICQGCLTNEATEVHHLTYENIFNEFVFELISLCNNCHLLIHKD